MAALLTYTPPADIDGEPEEVRELSIQQLTEAAAQFSELGIETLRQLCAAGLDRCPDKATWAASPEGQAAIELSRQIEGLIGGVNRLSQAV